MKTYCQFLIVPALLVYFSIVGAGCGSKLKSESTDTRKKIINNVQASISVPNNATDAVENPILNQTEKNLNSHIKEEEDGYSSDGSLTKGSSEFVASAPPEEGTPSPLKPNDTDDTLSIPANDTGKAALTSTPENLIYSTAETETSNNIDKTPGDNDILILEKKEASPQPNLSDIIDNVASTSTHNINNMVLDLTEDNIPILTSVGDNANNTEHEISDKNSSTLHSEQDTLDMRIIAGNESNDTDSDTSDSELCIPTPRTPDLTSSTGSVVPALEDLMTENDEIRAKDTKTAAFGLGDKNKNLCWVMGGSVAVLYGLYCCFVGQSNSFTVDKGAIDSVNHIRIEKGFNKFDDLVWNIPQETYSMNSTHNMGYNSNLNKWVDSIDISSNLSDIDLYSSINEDVYSGGIDRFFAPTAGPISVMPSARPTAPICRPTSAPTFKPILAPSIAPTPGPTSVMPSVVPTSVPTSDGMCFLKGNLAYDVLDRYEGYCTNLWQGCLYHISLAIPIANTTNLEHIHMLFNGKENIWTWMGLAAPLCNNLINLCDDNIDSYELISAFPKKTLLGNTETIIFSCNNENTTLHIPVKCLPMSLIFPELLW